MDWKSYFTMLSDWKKLPAYKAEPRIDSLIGYYLKQILADYCHDNIIGIIPELPIRLGTIDSKKYQDTNFADRSYKVDFYLLSSNGTNYLVEFKTDMGSISDKQRWYLNKAKDMGMEALVQGICRIASVSTYKEKYDHLLNKLTALGLIDNCQRFSGKSTTIELIYVQPQTESGIKCIDFEWITNWMRQKYKNSEFELEFANTLEDWSPKQENGGSDWD